MIDIEPLVQAIRARIMDQVPVLADKVFDKATEGDGPLYATFGALYGIADDVECIKAESWTIQIDIYQTDSSKAVVGRIAGQVKSALHDWSDTDSLTMHPLRVTLVRIMDDPDGVTVHGVVQVEAMIEG